jgi:hypothetical protein
MSTLLGGGPHYACDSFGHLFPLRLFDEELLSAYLCQAVVLEFPVAIRGGLPSGSNPSSSLEAMKRGIEGSVLHLQEIICRALDVLADLVAVSGSVKKRPQDEHVQRALKEICALLCLFRHGRHSTFNVS